MKSVKGPAFTAGGKAGPAGKTSPAVAPAVDQQSEDIASLLRNFDHHSAFGPALGMTRLERWNRAEGYSLHPPKEVYDVLMADAQKPKPKLQWSTFEHMV